LTPFKQIKQERHSANKTASLLSSTVVHGHHPTYSEPRISPITSVKKHHTPKNSAFKMAATKPTGNINAFINAASKRATFETPVSSSGKKRPFATPGSTTGKKKKKQKIRDENGFL